MDDGNNDPFSLTEDQLVERLENFGIENVRIMDLNERVILFLQLMGEAEAPPLLECVPADRSSTTSASAPPVALGGFPANGVGRESANATEGGEENDDVVVMGSDAKQYEEAVASLCSITGTDEESARHLLEALGWDLNAAIAMYMEQEGIGGQDDHDHRDALHHSSSGSGMNVMGQGIQAGPGMMGMGGPGDINNPMHAILSQMASDAQRGLDPMARDPMGAMFGVGGPAHALMSRASMGRAGVPAGWHDDYEDGHMGDDDDDEEYGNHVMDEGTRAASFPGAAGVAAAGDGVSRGGSRSQGHDRGPRVGRHASHGGWAGSMAGVYRGGSRAGPDQFDEEGVRLPDAVRQQRLLGGSQSAFESYGHSELARADAPHVEWLFPPPRQVNFHGSFQEGRTIARDEKKWILVNIQSHEEFSSQMLNRDTWTDETVISLLRTSFIFWQRGHTSPDAQAYMRTHTLSEFDLPHIAVIDSRTGAKIVTVKGFLSPGDLAMALLEFLEENSFDDNRAPKSRNIDTTKDHRYDEDDDSPTNATSSTSGGGNFMQRLSAAADSKDGTDHSSSFKSGSGSASASSFGSPSSAGLGAGAYGPGSSMSKASGGGVAGSGLGGGSSGGISSASGAKSDATRPDLAGNDAMPRPTKSAKHEPPEAKAAVMVDYGPSPEEPSADDDPASVAKISVKFPWGKAVARRFRKNDKVRALYAFAQHMAAANDSNTNGSSSSKSTGTTQTEFDLFTAFPPTSLSDKKEETLSDTGLAGSQVIMRWVDSDGR